MSRVLRRVYLDCAANTPLLPEVRSVMAEAWARCGNSSAIHQEGRELKTQLEAARRDMADVLKILPAELCMTASGTEANNWALFGAAAHLNVTRIITSPIEHEAILRPVEQLKKQGIECRYLPVNKQGELDLNALKDHLQAKHEGHTLVSFMHANNEIGNVNDLAAISELCRAHRAFFHTDAVQSMGSGACVDVLPLVDMASASAHKFHGPLGAGFLYVRQGMALKPLIYGGQQERGMRAGTENVPSIIGMMTALKSAYQNAEERQNKCQKIKQYAIERLLRFEPEVQFNGYSAHLGKSLNTILSFSLPSPFHPDDLVMQLDMKGIAVASGSACHSGAVSPSHVLRAIHAPLTRAHLRCSFSHLNTTADIDYLMDQLQAVRAHLSRKAPKATH